MRSQAKIMALGGVTAALAVILMCLGTLIPVATYMVPMLLCLFLGFLLPMLGKKAAFAWYLAVAVLGALFAPDKEAASLFFALGYYPILKSWLERRKLAILWKLAFFNAVILVMYWLLMNLMGMTAIRQEFRELGVVMTLVTLLLGNVTFFLMDRLLDRKLIWRRR